MEYSNPGRRDVLRTLSAAGVAVLAGCSGSDGSASGGAAESLQWRSHGGDAGNTGATPAASAPSGDGTMETLFSVDGSYGRPNPPVTDGDTLAIYNGNQTLYGVSFSGDQQWSYEIARSLNVTDERITRAIRDGTVYFPTDAGITAISEGSREWAVSTTHIPSSSPTVTADALYVRTGKNTFGNATPLAVVSIGLDGNERWRHEPDWKVLRRPAVSQSTVLTYRTTQTGIALRALDASDGTKLWDSPSAGNFATVPVVRDGTVYGLNRTGQSVSLVATAVSDGSKQWESDPVEPGGKIRSRHMTAPCVDDKRVYLAVKNTLVAFDADTGASVWDSPYVASSSIGMPPRTDGDTVYLVPGGSTIRAVDAETGTQRWSKSPSGTTSGLSNVVVLDSGVYVMSDDLIRIA